MPSSPTAAIAALTGTTSATVIQSSPSMKFTRFTNHNPPMTSAARSIHQGRNGTTRISSGSAKTTVATASACSRKRGTT